MSMFADFASPRVLVLGAGESGLAMARFAHAHGAAVRMTDTRTDPPIAERVRAVLGDVRLVQGEPRESWLDDIDLIALSPGLSPFLDPVRALLDAARSRGIAIWGEFEFYAQALAHLRTSRGYAPRTIGITGTNGKTTVTALAGFLATSAGTRTRVAGNISPAVLDALSDALAADDLPDVWVLELSSFQLESAPSLALDAAVVLNVTEDHLDWHPSFDEYAQAKGRIYQHARVRVANRADPRTLALAGPAALTIGLDAPAHPGDLGVVSDPALRWIARCEGDAPARKKRRGPDSSATEDDSTHRIVRLMPADALRIAGDHNLLNAQAALALVSAVDLPAGRALHALREFRGLPHRVEFVRSIDGVDFIDDSKGTNVGATVAALDGLRRRVVLIAGGDGKGQDFAPLARPLADWARALVLIGRDADRIASIAPVGLPTERAESLDDAVGRAARLARAGDAVLLSPACASFDMFRNYAHRAEAFVSAVRDLAAARGDPC